MPYSDCPWCGEAIDSKLFVSLKAERDAQTRLEAAAGRRSDAADALGNATHTAIRHIERLLDHVRSDDDTPVEAHARWLESSVDDLRAAVIKLRDAQKAFRAARRP